MSDTETPTLAQHEPPPATHREILIVLPGLLLAIMLAMLDSTIVSTAMPRIVGDLHGLTKLSWVITAYILGTTVSTPLWGKIGDMYGRKAIFLTSIGIFLLGSALSGMAHNMEELIGFRALQGLGAGGLMVGAMAIMGDLISPRERGRYQGYTAAASTIAMVAGPLVGGYITDHLSWRWAFYVNLPLGAVALFLVVSRLHLPRRRTEHRIDWAGSAVLAVAITALVLVTTWGGTRYPWASGQILALAAVAVLAFGVFLLIERRAAEPVLPLNVFANRNFSLSQLIGFLLGLAMFGAISFLPLFQQLVQGASATNSGLLLLPMMAGMLATSLLAGQLITATGRYRLYPVLGGLLTVLGAALLATQDEHTGKLATSLYMTVLGAGMGFLLQVTLLISLNSVRPRDLGVASSAATFFRSIGGLFGVALFGSLFNQSLRDNLTASVGTGARGSLAGGQLASLTRAKLASLDPVLVHAILHGIADALSHVFIWCTVIAVLIPVAAGFIRHVPLRSAKDRLPAPATATGPESDLVTAAE